MFVSKNRINVSGRQAEGHADTKTIMYEVYIIYY